jgi:hypothetical protein
VLSERAMSLAFKFARGLDGICFASERAFYEALGCGEKSAFRALNKRIREGTTRLRSEVIEAGQRNRTGRLFSHRRKLIWLVTRQEHRAEQRAKRKGDRQAKKRSAAAPAMVGPSKRAWQRAQEPAQFPAEATIANEEVKAFRQALARNFASAPVGPHPSREEQLAALAALDDVKKPAPPS